MKPVLALAPGLAIAVWLGATLFPGTAIASDFEHRAASDSVSTDSLEDLLAEAELSHPATLSARAQAQADAERPSQAGSLPDPVIGAAVSNFRVDDFALDSSPMAGVELRFRQAIPFPGKLGRRKSLAEARANISEQIAREIASDVRARVKSRYWSLSAAVAIEEITRHNVAVLGELIDVANSRFAVGMGAQQDVLQAQAALSELQTQLLRREQETRNAQRELNIAVGRPAYAPPIRAERLVLEVPSATGESLVETAAEHNPELGVRVAEVTAAQRSVEEALRDRWPDFGIGGGYRIRDAIDGGVSDGGDMFSLSLDMTIPLYAGSKQNRRVAETQSRLLAVRHAEANLRLQIGSITRNLVDESSRLLAQAVQFRDEVVPQDRLALEAAVSDYSVARVQFVTVLNNWQALLRDEIALEELTATFGVRIAELEFVVGRKFQ